MSKRIFKSDLSVSGIKKLTDQLHDYADNELRVKAEMIVRQLADYGIRVAEYSVYNVFRPHIDFVFEPLSTSTDYRFDGQLVGRDNSTIPKAWYGRKGQYAGHAEISPILMAEFGAGPYALNGHRGTFPGQKHAFETKWFWRDGNGVLHSSEEDYTMIATQPMYHAYIEMMQKAEMVARQVFGA